MREAVRVQADSRVRLMRLPRRDAGGLRECAPALVHAPVVSNDRVTRDYWLLSLQAPAIAEGAEPGQFVMLTVAREGKWAPVLPRPMALYSWDRAGGAVQVLYRTVGGGTQAMTEFGPGEIMTTVGPLGRGFYLMPDTGSILLLGRGIGTCSLTALCSRAVERGISVHCVVSARNEESLIGGDFYRNAGAESVWEVTDTEGSSSVDSLRPRLDTLLQRESVRQIFVCGSNRLLVLSAQLADVHRASVQVSLEAHMACGLGYCHGCSTAYPGLAEEAPLVCKDGPVFAYAGAVT